MYTNKGDTSVPPGPAALDDAGKRKERREELRNFTCSFFQMKPSLGNDVPTHIMPVDENMSVPNIRNDYTVTEKADGSRKLLFINSICQFRAYVICVFK